ncbi:hypothetical protein DSM03_1011022 [Leeuwenhoekiella aestuarii]|uniref:Uncharacterized protein n=1 Tax=Leeuwenhoekiella aestuarii TaxID=2249426 RepID=A0A4Q0NZE7_9FLAO|nr:hypothetical protein DSM04_101533 [Leeuwenhoekiella aestuarii]RXG19645.1 hypothetical protein DSM03_1011022 [Leeuwenhoekiella aestuarii]
MAMARIKSPLYIKMYLGPYETIVVERSSAPGNGKSTRGTNGLPNGYRLSDPLEGNP